MVKKYSAVLLAIAVISISYQADARARKRSKTNVKLLEAYSQRTIPGIPGGQIRTEYYFIVKWEGAQYPESFFWRGDGGWLTCNIARAHKSVHSGTSSTPEYTTVAVNGDDIHKGDTLQLKPTPGGKFPIPTEIPATAKNTLFYKTGGSGWLALPVKSISKKPDVARQ